MAKIKLDDDVPIPGSYSGEDKYPFRDMKVGQSFFEEGKTSDQLTNSASHWRKKMGWKFKARNVTEQVTDDDGTVREAKGARIWRIE